MDIALCIIDKKSFKLQFSGANNFVYIIRNKKLIEFQCDKMPISYSGEKIEFFFKKRIPA
jgi:hypothetical protein